MKQQIIQQGAEAVISLKGDAVLIKRRKDLSSGKMDQRTMMRLAKKFGGKLKF